MGRARRAAEERGAAAVEFALVAPLVFLLLFGTLQFGWGFWEQESAQASVREATRLAAVGIPDQSAYVASVTCLTARNGAHGATLTQVKVAFVTSAQATEPPEDRTELGPGSYAEVTLTFSTRLSAVIPSPFADEDGHFTASGRTRIEQLGPTDVRDDFTEPVTTQGCA